MIAAIAFPVFVRALGEGKKVACANNFRQAWIATNLYATDYEDRLMPTNHQPTAMNSRSDRTWVQLILPYITAFDAFKCPADSGQRPKPEATFDEDLIPGDTASRYYQASQRSNIGYNYLYMAPIVKAGDTWVVQPHSMSEVSASDHSILFIDTVYELKDGQPTGGGNYLAIPPCRYEANDNTTVDTFFGSPAGVAEVMAANKGWTVSQDSNYQYGGAWPWHNGRVTVISLDGVSRALQPEQLSKGCDVQNNWNGYISNGAQYLWHTQDN